MNGEKRRKRKTSQILTDNSKCNIIGTAITDLISMSENVNFVDKCHQILQTENISQVKHKINAILINSKCKKRSFREPSASDSEKQDTSDSLFDNLNDSCMGWIKELEGFDKWSDDENDKES